LITKKEEGMNKKLSLLLTLVLVTSIAFVSGCSPASTGGGSKVVYYMAPTLFDEFQAGTNKMMLQFGQEAGYEVRALNGNNNADTQINQIDDAVNQKPVAIILNAVDAATVTGSVDKARQAGIPVLVYDRFIQDTQVDFHSVVGTIKIGQMAAGEIARLLKEKNGEEKGTVLEIMGDPGDNYTILIDQGFQEAMKAFPNIQIVAKTTAGWEPTVAASIVDDQLTANADTDLIFVHADFRATSIVPVLQSHGIDKGQVILVGTDGAPTGLQSIRDGWMTLTIGVPMVEQVYGIWQFLPDVLAKKSFQDGTVDVKGIQAEMKNESWGPTLYLPGQIVDSSNVDNENLWGNMKVDVQQ
jgi:ribose transport system substrate-binding protein